MNRIFAALRPRAWSLKYRIAIAVGLMFAVTVVLTNAVQIHFLRADLARVLSDQQYTLVQHTARDIDAKFDTGVAALAGTAAFITEADIAQPQRLREELHARPALMAFFDDLIVLSPAGRIVTDYPELPGRAGLDAADRAYYQAVVKKHQTVISEPLIGKTRGEPIVQVAAPILTLDDRLLGMLVGVIRLYRPGFLGRLGEEKIGQSGYFALITRGSKPIYVVHPDRKRMLKERNPNGSAAVTNAILGFDGTADGISSEGVDTIYSAQQLRAVPWVLIAAAPKSEVFAPVAAAQRRVWVAAGVSTLVLIPAAWFIVWFLLGPLRLLSASIAGLREGEGDFTPIPVRRADEIGNLTTRFNLMMYDRMAADKARMASEERLRLLADNMPVLISYIDANMRVVFANSCYKEWFGLDPAAMVGQRVDEIFQTPNYELAQQQLGVALAGQATTFEREVNTRAGLRIVRTSFYPQFGENGMVVGIYHMTTDISEDRRVQAELDALARRDPLTGLYNRRSFEELLPQAVARATRNNRRLALLFVDLDRFKAVNDKQGHDAGDDVLKAVAKRLGANVRLSDTVARLGGDEFVAILEEVASQDDAMAIAQKILDSIREPISTRAGECSVSASIGVAMCQGKEEDCRDLLKRADAAQYAAKGAGRGRIHLE